MKRRSTHDRFSEKHTLDPGGCWLWTAYVTRLGYGRFGMNGLALPAHRVSWMLHFGPIPDGLFVCHRCDVRNCVNPAHLFLGTALDNAQDMMLKGRGGQRKGEAHHRAKLTAEQVLDIRKQFLCGVRQSAIRRQFGISKAQVSKICRNQSWT